MNRSALKTYAPKARLDFIRAVTDRAAFFGLTPKRTEPMQETGDVVIIGGRAFPKVVAQQRRSLEARIQRQGFDQVMEAMAYTWFNRFVALRYMELHGYLDHGYRVLSSADTETRRRSDAETGRTSPLRVSASPLSASPEILMHAEHVMLPGLDAQQVINLKLDGTKEAELYRLLLVAQCNALHQAMPFLFEKIADETELLLPDNLLHSDSVIRKLVNEIEEADWQQVEIIGWLYQFYISDKKDEVIGKVVKSEDIPAATQLFTPNWIVKYLVQNTLGRQWLATYPDSPLRQQMQYYIEPAEQMEEVKAQLTAITPKSLDPETLTLLDDACGSGHILVEAYDLFKAIYQERGYRSKDIPRLILQKNLFGLEIDDRAAQLAAFALLMKARADDRRIFADRVQPNVVAIQESKGLLEMLDAQDERRGEGRRGDAEKVRPGELDFSTSTASLSASDPLRVSPSPAPPISASPRLNVSASFPTCLRELIRLFEHGKTFGSLIRVPPDLAAQLPAARQSIESMISKGQLWEHRAATLLLPLIKQAELLARTYDALAANPPYMGSKGMPPQLKEFAKAQYPQAKADLFSMFMERGFQFVTESGLSGMVTMQNWMFLSSFEELRKTVLERTSLLTLAHFGPRAFSEISGEVVQTAAWVIGRRHVRNVLPVFFRLVDGDEAEKEAALRLKRCRMVGIRQEDFKAVPGSPIAYWMTEKDRQFFCHSKPLTAVAKVCNGMKTGRNELFTRFWFEVSCSRIGFGYRSQDDAEKSGLKWFPYNKGGEYRKWFGNCEFVVNWSNRGYEIKNYTDGKGAPNSRERPENRPYYFKPGITWSFVSSAPFGVRLVDHGLFFDVAGSTLFPTSESELSFLCGYLNGKPLDHFLRIMNPTLNVQVENVASLPVPIGVPPDVKAHVGAAVAQAVAIARRDWNSHETAWDFERFPLLNSNRSGAGSAQDYQRWVTELEGHVQQTKALEEEINRAVISLCGLDGEISSAVDDAEITLRRADREQDMRRFVSYTIGCMMGRYSLDRPGLVYAHSGNEGFDPSHYHTFPADADGIIPITELAWFPDDATERFVEFIAKAWPREHLEENLKFIADNLGPNRDEHPRDTIRRYLATGFYKDHLSTYKKRPIYWLFSSGKQRAFQCLVYLHRYHEGTLARMRTEYVIPLQGKIAHRIEQLAGDITAATSTSHRRKLEKEKESLVKQQTELAAFDEKLRHYADQRIALDLDDGVKVNYGKFGDLLAEVKAVTGGGEE